MLRATFIALSESKSLRSFAEKSRIGQRLSGRFVAGTSVEEALRATRAMNADDLDQPVEHGGPAALDRAPAAAPCPGGSSSRCWSTRSPTAPRTAA